MHSSFEILQLVDSEPEDSFGNTEELGSHYNNLFMKLEDIWLSDEHCELSITLGFLKYLKEIHESHHWISKGDSFYGDHLLFARLYEIIEDEIDLVAEKAISVSSVAAVDMTRTLQEIVMLNEYLGTNPVITIPDPAALARKSHLVESTFLEVLKICIDKLEEKSALTIGTENLLAGIFDTHEQSVYLLKQRVSM